MKERKYWTKREAEALSAAVQRCRTDKNQIAWQRVAEAVGTRTAMQCKSRYSSYTRSYHIEYGSARLPARRGPGADAGALSPMELFGVGACVRFCGGDVPTAQATFYPEYTVAQLGRYYRMSQLAQESLGAVLRRVEAGDAGGVEPPLLLRTYQFVQILRFKQMQCQHALRRQAPPPIPAALLQSGLCSRQYLERQITPAEFMGAQALLSQYNMSRLDRLQRAAAQ